MGVSVSKRYDDSQYVFCFTITWFVVTTNFYNLIGWSF